MRTKSGLILGAIVFGLGLAAGSARADDWSSAREELRRAEDELAKDTRQMNEAWSKGDRKGVQNEQREIVKDREAVARARTKLDDLRRSGRWNGYDSYDDDWNRRDGRNWDGDWWNRDVDSSRRSEWYDARNDLLKAEEELRKDQRQLREALDRRDYRGAENERREIDRDYAAVERARARLDSLSGDRHDRGKHTGWYKH